MYRVSTEGIFFSLIGTRVRHTRIRKKKKTGWGGTWQLHYLPPLEAGEDSSRGQTTVTVQNPLRGPSVT